MSEPKLTDEQLYAVTPGTGSLLLSAAAGSGKTFVLTRRIINTLLGSYCPPEQLLVVTFTRAAAASMKEKIKKAAADKLKEAKAAKDAEQIKKLSAIRSSLEKMRISTIDSYFLDLVRENFMSAGVEPDFRLLDEAQNATLLNDCLKEILGEFYLREPELAATLADELSGSYGDEGLAQAVRDLYKLVDSSPFPIRTLERMARSDAGVSPALTPAGRAILDHAASVCRDCAEHYQELADGCGADTLNQKADDIIRSEIAQIRACADKAAGVADDAGWDELRQALKSVSFDRLRFPETADPDEKSRVKGFRDKIKGVIREKLVDLMNDEAIYLREDARQLAPMTSALAGLAISLFERSREAKDKKNAYTFSDVTHMTAALLADTGPDGTLVPSKAALALRESFYEILIDEYQDTNEAQDFIFGMISRDGEKGNVFLVGDVKQSIYGFRDADPTIFTAERKRRVDKLDMKDGSFDDPGIKKNVYLSSNFRSRAGILNFANTLFTQLMSEKVGGVDYNETERLNPGASFKEREDPGEKDVEIDVTDICDKCVGYDEALVSYVADKVNNGGYRVWDSTTEAYRDATPGDFAVLVRNNSTVTAIEDGLRSRGVPAVSQKGSGFFGTYEIGLITSLIKIVINPLRDVDLAAVLYSPLFGFTADDLAVAGLRDVRSPLYRRIKTLASDDAISHPARAKAKNFVDTLSRLRAASVTASGETFISYLIEETRIDSLVSALEDGERRRANIAKLEDFCQSYFSGADASLSDLVRFLDKAESAGRDLDGAKTAPADEDAVRIMTMHASKGLQFPIVIVPLFSKQGGGGSGPDLYMSKRCGIGLKINKPRTLQTWETLEYKACRLDKKAADTSDEMRLLYVAVTRAEEKLLIPVVFNGAKSESDNPTGALKKINGLRAFVGEKRRVVPCAFEMNGNLSDWLLMAALRTREFCEVFGDGGCTVLSDDLSLRVSHVKITGRDAPDAAQGLTVSDRAFDRESVDEDTYSRVAAREAYRYPYAALGDLPGKLTASKTGRFAAAFSVGSDLTDDEQDVIVTQTGLDLTSVPVFASGESDAAASGTATHKFLEKCDLDGAADDPEGALAAMVALGVMTSQEASLVKLSEAAAFLRSDTGALVRRASFIRREAPFTMTVRAAELADNVPEAAADEQILVRGVMDLLFVSEGAEFVLDYKTDRVYDIDELVDRYATQMRLYKKAAARVYGLKDVKAVVYSLYLGKGVIV